MPSFLLILLVGVLRLWSGKGHQKGFFPVILLLLIVEFALICLVLRADKNTFWNRKKPYFRSHYLIFGIFGPC
jgi:glycosyltransferase involved in cell wall biosynthesis